MGHALTVQDYKDTDLEAPEQDQMLQQMTQ